MFDLQSKSSELWAVEMLSAKGASKGSAGLQASASLGSLRLGGEALVQGWAHSFCQGDGTTLLNDGGQRGPSIDCIVVKLICIHRKQWALIMATFYKQ